MPVHLRLVRGELEAPPADYLAAILAIDQTLGEIARCVSLLTSAEKPQVEVSLLGSNLLQLLCLIERSAAIESAVDALHDAAQRAAWGTKRGNLSTTDNYHGVGAAYNLLRSRVLAAQANVR